MIDTEIERRQDEELDARQAMNLLRGLTLTAILTLFSLSLSNTETSSNPNPNPNPSLQPMPDKL